MYMRCVHKRAHTHTHTHTHMCIHNKLRGFSDSFLSGVCYPSAAIRNDFVLQSKLHMLFQEKDLIAFVSLLEAIETVFF